mmetsp:Transcript_76445/g.224314  ORF Transcript_76445/g.224314 Transcript_76445/m.224314 type:complete len:249 (+) Transcript_76445:1209-1955(+)
MPCCSTPPARHVARDDQRSSTSAAYAAAQLSLAKPTPSKAACRAPAPTARKRQGDHEPRENGLPSTLALPNACASASLAMVSHKASTCESCGYGREPQKAASSCCLTSSGADSKPRFGGGGGAGARPCCHPSSALERAVARASASLRCASIKLRASASTRSRPLLKASSCKRGGCDNGGEDTVDESLAATFRERSARAPWRRDAKRQRRRVAHVPIVVTQLAETKDNQCLCWAAVPVLALACPCGCHA